MNLEKIGIPGTLELLAKQWVTGFITGLHKSPYHGFSVEFAEHRLYNSGESTRYIDWKVFARTDKLFVKRFEEETNLRCHILLDHSSSMFYPEKNIGKMRFSVFAAAALAQLLNKQRDAVALHVFSDQIELQTPVKSSSSHLRKLMLHLEQLLQKEPPIKSQTAVAQSLHYLAANIPRRSLIVILSDMMERVGEREDVFKALQHLKHYQHEVLLFHVYDKQTEMDFDFEDRPYIFEDLESGKKVKLHPQDVREMYQKKYLAHFEEVKSKAAKSKIDFIAADISQDVDQILIPYLIKRSKMH